MKKVFCKLTSVILAVAIVLCSLSVVVFAEEIAAPTAVCTHKLVTMVAGDQYCEATSDTGHTWYNTAIYTCTDCGYSYTETTGIDHFESHSWGSSYYVPGSYGVVARDCQICGYTMILFNGAG